MIALLDRVILDLGLCFSSLWIILASPILPARFPLRSQLIVLWELFVGNSLLFLLLLLGFSILNLWHFNYDVSWCGPFWVQLLSDSVLPGLVCLFSFTKLRKFSFIVFLFFSYILFFLYFFIVQVHCLHFLSTTPHHPSNTHLPPLIIPSLALSMCPSYMFPDGPSPIFPLLPLPTPLWLLSVCSFLLCLWFYFSCLFVLFIRFHLQVRSYGICLSPSGLFHLACHLFFSVKL